jgi:hypothetical protein
MTVGGTLLHQELVASWRRIRGLEKLDDRGVYSQIRRYGKRGHINFIPYKSEREESNPQEVNNHLPSCLT